MSTIYESHRSEWEQSAVSADIIERNVWSIDDARDVDELLNRNSDKSKKWKHSNNLVPCWAVAGVDPKTGEQSFKGAQVKPDTPPIDSQTQKALKYLGASKTPVAPLFLGMDDGQYWPKLITDLTRPIVITEGAKKAGAVMSQGIPCISVPGVSTGGKKGRLKPELELFARYGRSIYLAFDRDVISKRQVRTALHNLGRMLADKGAMVYVLEWDNAHKGIDDWIAATDGNVTARLPVAPTLEEWREKAEAEFSDEPDEPCLLARRYKRVEGKLSGRVRWNHLRGAVELDGQPVELDSLRMMLALKHNIQIPAEDCSQIVQHMAKRQAFSPVVEYLNAVANEYPADDELLDAIAATYLGADSRLHRTYLRKTLVSAVARAIKPGCKVDTVCILAGVQGVGKSTFWKVLSRDWFDDSIGNSGDKDERLKLHKAWFVEWAELETVFRRKDISATKAFITTQIDQLRPPYGRTVQDFPRPSIIVGTTNFDEFLADPTGNRRFWVVPISIDAIPLEQLGENCDRIWAAAVHAFRRGESWTLPPELRQEAQLDNLDYALSDPWESVVFSYLDERQVITSSEVLTNALQLELDKQNRASQMRVTNLIKKRGWASTRTVVQGKRFRIWAKPLIADQVVQVVQVGQGQLKPLFREDEDDGQPRAQPRAQPEEVSTSLTESCNKTLHVPNLPDQPNHFPLNPPPTRVDKCISEGPLKTSMDESEIDLEKISLGDLVIPTGLTTWFRRGSARLPKGSLAYGRGKETEVQLATMETVGMSALQGPSLVLKISDDGQRLKVRNQETGLTSVLSVVGTRLLPKEEP